MSQMVNEAVAEATINADAEEEPQETNGDAEEIKVEAELKQHQERQVEQEEEDQNTSLEEQLEGMSDDAAVATPVNKGEKADEITSIEREIAELHNMVPSKVPAVQRRLISSTPQEAAASAKDKFEEVEMQRDDVTDSALLGTLCEDLSNQSGEQFEQRDRKLKTPEPLEDIDLIAVLKGDESDTKNKDISPSKSIEGVTIEGEGEYQIMEIEDDDELEEELAAEPPSAYATTGKSVSPRLQPAKRLILSKEEERKLAMQQMAGLSQSSNRRRKQELKTQPQQQLEDEDKNCESTDLVKLLGADWSDEDNQTELPKAAAPVETVKTKKQPVVPLKKATVAATSAAVAAAKPADKAPKARKSPPKITSVVVIKNSGTNNAQPAAAENKTGGGANAPASKVRVIKEKKPPAEDTNTAPAQTTGFKRQRIIKRKIIWDPDAPETQFSYANLVRPSGSANAAAQNKPTKTATAKPEHTLLKKEVQKKRPATPKERSTLIKTEEGSPEKHVRSITPKVLLTKVTPTQLEATVSPTGSSPPTKRRSQTPVANGANKKKKISELDKLMGDEGAANMLKSLKTKGDGNQIKKAPPPKKEPGTGPAGGKPKRVVKPKPSSTWDYVYKQQAAEDSMIIRRRSNSSYSSSASVHRLSQDSCPTGTPKKPGPKSATKSPLKPITSQQQAAAAAKSDEDATSEEDSPGIPMKTAGGKTFIFAKPISKTNQKPRPATKQRTPTDPLANDIKIATANAGVRRQIPPQTTPATTAADGGGAKKMPKHDATNGGVSAKLINKLATITLNLKDTKPEQTFDTEILMTITLHLENFAENEHCQAVLLCTTGANFCQGIDYAEIAEATEEERTDTANALGEALKCFIKTLATFPKPIIASVPGNNVGIGVTMLLLCDIVLINEKTTFEAPYAKIGLLPEGLSVWNYLTQIRPTLKTKLFMLCEKLNAAEAVNFGLAYRIVAGNKLNEEATNTAKKVASMHSEALKMLKIRTNKQLDMFCAALEDDIDNNISFWNTEECYDLLQKFHLTGEW